MKKARQASMGLLVLLVLLVVATAAGVVNNRPISAANSDVTGAVSYKVDPDWPKLPPGRPEPKRLQRRIGYMHGDVAVASNGEVYLSVQNMWYVSVLLDGKQTNADMGLGPEYLDPYAGLQVYAPDGTFLRNVANAPTDLHGFIINKESDGEYIYGVRVAAINAPPDQTKADWYHQAVVKMTLDGKIVLSIPATAFPEKYRIGRDGTSFMRLSGLAVAPNGDIYVTDGYASDYIHRFDKTGRYLNTFGGKQKPYEFSTLHKFAIDSRFKPLRIIATDRANNRMVHLSMGGDFLGVIADGMMLPAAVAIWGDYAAVAELGGQITVLDKEGRRAAVFGTNTRPDEKGNRTVEPSKWRPGVVTAPHGIAVNEHGDLFVSELNTFGRVHRFNRQ
jgi:hypothetical protein